MTAKPSDAQEPDVIARLRKRVLLVHGGTGDLWKDHWNLTGSDSLLHREAAAALAQMERERDDARAERDELLRETTVTAYRKLELTLNEARAERDAHKKAGEVLYRALDEGRDIWVAMLERDRDAQSRAADMIAEEREAYRKASISWQERATEIENRLLATERERDDARALLRYFMGEYEVLNLDEETYDQIDARAHALHKLVAERDRARADAEGATQELRNIAIAKRFDHKVFSDDTEFADWAQNRARYMLDALAARAAAAPSEGK